VLHAPEFRPIRRCRHQVRDVHHRELCAAHDLIGGTRYAGELKKSIFSVLNYLLPLKGVLSMPLLRQCREAG